jgi:Rad3-related DNA helicase
VIRTPSDRGVLHLIDDRFARREVLRLLPTWWRIDTFPPKVIAALHLAGT